MVAPVIPALTDSELERILEAAAAVGARQAAYVALRLPLELKDLFEEWLAANVPGRASHVLSLVRDMRGGALYQSQFGTRMSGTGPFAALLGRRFELACKRLGLNRARVALDTSLFRAPKPPSDQLDLF
jgi:DNA repair photolyase